MRSGLRSILDLPALAAVALIRLYQRTLAKALPNRCRFHPSCSEYAARAIEGNGLFIGVFMAGWRVIRCVPWSAGGFDSPRVRRDRRRAAQEPEPVHG